MEHQDNMAQDNMAADSISDNEIIENWYRYAATQPGFVGTALSLLRDREGKTRQQQQNEFGINDKDFYRLQGMTMPRPPLLASDAHRIAEVCRVTNQLAFVQAIILAHHLASANDIATSQEDYPQTIYQAAYDVVDDLDTLTNDEDSQEP